MSFHLNKQNLLTTLSEDLQYPSIKNKIIHGQPFSQQSYLEELTI